MHSPKTIVRTVNIQGNEKGAFVNVSTSGSQAWSGEAVPNSGAGHATLTFTLGEVCVGW